MKIVPEETISEAIEYWRSLPRGCGHYNPVSLERFLMIFTIDEVKFAMRIAQQRGRKNYFRYLCGILHNWRKQGKVEMEADNGKR